MIARHVAVATVPVVPVPAMVTLLAVEPPLPLGPVEPFGPLGLLRSLLPLLARGGLFRKSFGPFPFRNSLRGGSRIELFDQKFTHDLLGGRFGKVRQLFPGLLRHGLHGTPRRATATTHNRSTPLLPGGALHARFSLLLFRRTGTAAAFLRSGSFSARVVVCVHRNEFVGVVHIVFPETF